MLVITYFYLFTCYPNQSLIKRLNESVKTGVFLGLFVLTHGCLMFFFIILSTYTKVDDDISLSEETRDTVLRYVGLIVFFASALLFVPVTIWHHEQPGKYEYFAMVSPIGTLIGYVLLFSGYVTQVFIPGTASDCPCEIRNTAIAGFVASLIPPFLFVYDVFWAGEYYFDKQYSSVPEENEGRFVSQTVELGII